jgi:hypothetical protein
VAYACARLGCRFAAFLQRARKEQTAAGIVVAMIPTFFKTADFTEPHTPLCYMVAANGLFLVRKTGLFTSISRTSGVAGLEAQQPTLSLRFGKIPRPVMERVYGFFDWAWRQWQSEAILFLYYSATTGRFLLDAPPQTIYLYRRMGGERRDASRIARCPGRRATSSSATCIRTPTFRPSSASKTTATTAKKN